MSRRRPGLALAVASGAAATLALAMSPANATAKTERQSFSPPDGPMVLTRELRRPLGDGNEIVTRRRYEIRFERDGNGYRIDGRLLDATVEAPAILEPIARLERERPDVGLFPLYLDGQGLLADHSPPAHAPAVAEAVGVTGAQLARLSLPAADLAQATAFAGQFLGPVGFTSWPRDLFRPKSGAQAATMQIDLPGDLAGEVSVSITAVGEAATGLLQSLDRTTVTTVGETSKSSRETFTLAHIR